MKNLVFHDEITKVQEEVTKLTDQGINKIIALGHAGFELDKQLAAAVEGVDIVVGGHTDTFLYTGTQNDTNKHSKYNKGWGVLCISVQPVVIMKYLMHFYWPSNNLR